MPLFEQTVEEHSDGHFKIMRGLWLVVDRDGAPGEWVNWLEPHVGKNDRLLIFEAAADNCAGLAPESIWSWLRDVIVDAEKYGKA